MLEDREAQAFLFGSYARGQARPKSDVDIMVVEKTLRYPRLREIYLLRARLKIDKDVDLLVIDEENFNTWKNSPGTVQNEVYREGVRLV
jgi:predicted nucleotidyltransferase